MIRIAGVDEVGRGPLVGPVVAAAVILKNNHGIVGLTDSKKLTEKKREHLYPQIIEHALAYHIAFIDAKTIDDINILQATMRAMKNAVQSLEIQPDKVLVDGNRLPEWTYESEAIVKGDALIEVIGAASILAKVARDNYMCDMARKYPVYGFEKHKGYGTKQHLQALAEHGYIAEHRKTFKPISTMIAQGVKPYA